jgi:hypothetical protein
MRVRPCFRLVREQSVLSVDRKTGTDLGDVGSGLCQSICPPRGVIEMAMNKSNGPLI